MMTWEERSRQWRLGHKHGKLGHPAQNANEFYVAGYEEGKKHYEALERIKKLEAAIVQGEGIMK